TPVREALRILGAEGFVTASSHKGVTVPPFEVEQAQEIFDLRMLLEPDLVRRAISGLSSEKFAELCHLNAKFEAAVGMADHVALRTANYRFHFRLYELADRPQTLAFVRVLWAKYPFHHLDAIAMRTVSVAKEHRRFLERLEADD